MDKKKRAIIGTIVLLCICGSLAYMHEIGVFSYHKKLVYKAKQENTLMYKAFEKERIRLQLLVAKSNDKCPTEVLLQTAPRFDMESVNIPAYPHLSDIYVHILPAMYTWDRQRFSILAKDKVKEFVNKDSQKRDVDKILSDLQSDNMPLLFIKAIEKSLAYCGGNKKGLPLKVKIINEVNHKNLEQDDALTIVVAPIFSAHSRDLSYDFQLHTAQYIPRWHIFPERYKSTSSGIYRMQSFGFGSDPFGFGTMGMHVSASKDIFVKYYSGPRHPGLITN